MKDMTTLVRREIEGTPVNFTIDQFVEMIMLDIETAKQTYRDITTKEANARYERDKNDYFERRNKEIEKIKEGISVRILAAENSYFLHIAPQNLLGRGFSLCAVSITETTSLAISGVTDMGVPSVSL